VAARNGADAVGHADQREAEGEANASKSFTCGAVSASDDSRAAPQQHKRKCADEFSQWFFYIVPFPSSSNIWTYGTTMRLTSVRKIGGKVEKRPRQCARGLLKRSDVCGLVQNGARVHRHAVVQI